MFSFPAKTANWWGKKRVGQRQSLLGGRVWEDGELLKVGWGKIKKRKNIWLPELDSNQQPSG
jgi:hypothetical protein